MTPQEIELKLELPAESLSRLERKMMQRRGAAVPPRHVDLVSVYFDTDKFKLRDNGFSLRLRQIGARHIQTVKQDGANTAFERGEWECEVESDKPDFNALRKTPLKSLLTKKLQRQLRPRFETMVHRTIYPIQSGKSEIALTVDEGKIEAGRRRASLREVELELTRGDRAELFRFARELVKDVPLRLALKSKAERSYELLAGEAPRPVKAAPIALGSDWNTQQSFQAIARACLQQLIDNEPAFRQNDAEALHQMRVALRRLRATISLFSDMLSDAESKRIRAELKWLNGELGPARELDVFVKRVVQPVAGSQAGQPGVLRLKADAEQRRERAFARAHTAFTSARCNCLLVDLAAWIEIGQWTRRDDDSVQSLRERSIATGATDELRRRAKKIVKRGKQLRKLPPEARHRLRIQVKKARYATEFFGQVFPGKKAGRRHATFFGRLKDLQDALGELNDIAVNRDLTADFVEGNRKGNASSKVDLEEAFAAGMLSTREEVKIASAFDQAQASYNAFAKTKPFWK